MLLDPASTEALDLLPPPGARRRRTAPAGPATGKRPAATLAAAAAASGAPLSTAPLPASSSSLLGHLDYTSTVCGARLLRTNVLQPLTDVGTLQLRLDALQELLESPTWRWSCQSCCRYCPRTLTRCEPQVV